MSSKNECPCRSFKGTEPQRMADFEEADLAFYLHILRTINIDKCKETCPRCTFIIEHTQKLLDKVRLERKSNLITIDFPRKFHPDDLGTLTSKTLFSSIQNKNMTQESNLNPTHFENLPSEFKDRNLTKRNKQYPFEKSSMGSKPKTDNLASLASKIDNNFEYAPNKTKSRLSPSDNNEIHSNHLKNKEKEIIPLFHKKLPGPSELTSKDKVGVQFRSNKKIVPAEQKASTTTLQGEINIKIKDLHKNKTKIKVGEAGTYNIQKDPLLNKENKTQVKVQVRVAEEWNDDNKSNAEIGQSNLEKNQVVAKSHKGNRELEKNSFLIDKDAEKQLRNATGKEIRTKDLSRQNIKEKGKKGEENILPIKENSLEIKGIMKNHDIEIVRRRINAKNEKTNKVENRDIKVDSKPQDNKSIVSKVKRPGKGDLPEVINADEMLRLEVDQKVKKNDEFPRNTIRKESSNIKDPVKSTLKGFGNLARNEPYYYMERSGKLSDKASENNINGQQKKKFKSSTEPKLSYDFSKGMENNQYTESLRTTDRRADASKNKEIQNQTNKKTFSTDKLKTHEPKNAPRQEYIKGEPKSDNNDVTGIFVKERWESEDNESNCYGTGKRDKNFTGKNICREKVQRGYDDKEPQMPQLNMGENKNNKRLYNKEIFKNSKQNTQSRKANSGIIRYALSDRQFIDKGWTVLPKQKIISEELTCGMHPAHPEFDWFKQHNDKGTIFYDGGEKLAEIDGSGRGRWFYKNGRTALEYYGCDMDSADDLNGKLRVVIYSSGCEPDQRNQLSPITVLASFDYAGNGVVFDHSGKERLKYNQRIGAVLDPKICPVSRWKWHSLSDSLKLKSVKIAAETHMDDPNIKKLGDSSRDRRNEKIIDEDIMAIEHENLTKKKNEIIDQEFYAYQVKPKAFKINNQFSLRIMDQATIYIIFRNDLKQMKLNVGMYLKNKDIEKFEVKTNIEMEPNAVHPS